MEEFYFEAFIVLFSSDLMKPKLSNKLKIFFVKNFILLSWLFRRDLTVSN